MAHTLARIGAALKSALRFPQYGGQGINRGGLADWVTWSGSQPFNYAESAGPLHRNGVVMTCTAVIMRAFPEPPIQVIKEDEDGEENEVPQHPLTLAFRKPNPFYGSDCLWQRVVFDFVLYGQAFLYKLRNGSGDVIALYHVPQHRLSPQWNTSGKEFVSHYLFTIDAKSEDIPVADLVHFRFGGDPDHERTGLAVLSGGLREIATLNEGSNFRAALLSRMGVPSHLLQSKNPDKPITAQQADQLNALWQAKVCGNERGGVLIPNFPLDAVQVGMSPKDLDIGTMTFEAMDQVSSQVGVPAMMAGLSSGSAHKTYANFKEAREGFTETWLIPAWKQFAQELTLQLLPDYSDDEAECVEFDISKVRSLQEDENALWSRIDAAIKTGWVQVNEGRALVNLPPVEGGDVFLPSGGTAPVDLSPPPPAQMVPPEAGAAPAAVVATNGNGRQEMAAAQANGRA